MTSAQAVCETNITSGEQDGDELQRHHRAIREDTVVLDILAQAAELETQNNGIMAALQRVVGLGSQYDMPKGTIYRSESAFRRGRHERPRYGRHSLGHYALNSEIPFRPLASSGGASRHTEYVPRHAARQQDTIVLPTITKRAASHRKPEKSRGAWRTRVAGLGAVAVACTSVGVAVAKDSAPSGEGSPAVSIPVQGSEARQIVLPSGREGRSDIADRHARTDGPGAGSPSPSPTSKQGEAPGAVRVVPSGLTKQQQASMNTLVAAFQAVPAAELKGVCPSVLLAKAIVVSDWGKSKEAHVHNNPFGLLNAQGKTIHYTSLNEGVRAQVRRIITSPYYRENALFPGQPVTSCATNGRTFLLADKSGKAVRKNLIFNYFKGGLDGVETSGLVGNAELESGVRSDRVQTVGGSAKGLHQWEGNRFAPKPGRSSKTLGLKAFAARLGEHWSNFRVQLAYVKYEFSHGEKRAYKKLKAADTPTEASIAVTDYYERPSRNPKTLHMKERIAASNQAYKEHIAHEKQAKNVNLLMKKTWFASIFSKRSAAAQG